MLELDGRPRHAWTDPLLLDRLIGNLLQNAVKFTDAGRVGLRAFDAAGSRVGIEVFDTGPGIPLDQQQRVFEEFYQLDNPSRDRARGIGLGLSIVRRLAELLDIELELRSAPGKGCLFSLKLPISSSVVARSPAVGPAHAPRVALNGKHAPIVLVVDDEPALLADMETMLGGRGYRVLVAANAAEACAKAAQQSPDVVLADFRLRNGETGLDAVRAVRRQLGRDVPALIVTGDTAPHRIAEAMASGLRVLHKPLDGRVLTHEIAALLSPADAAAPAQPGQG
jgi:CheY-like chemotaxis protein